MMSTGGSTYSHNINGLFDEGNRKWWIPSTGWLFQQSRHKLVYVVELNNITITITVNSVLSIYKENEYNLDTFISKGRLFSTLQ